MCVGESCSVSSDNHACRCFLADSVIELQLSSLDNGSSAVQKEWILFICRNSHCQRVCSHHILYSESRSYGRSCVCSSYSDHSGLCCHADPVSCNSVVGRIADCYAGCAVFSCLFNGHLHGLVACNHSHSVISIKNGSSWKLPDYVDLCLRVQDSLVDSVNVDRFEPVYTVTFNSPLVAFNKNVSADCCVLFWNSQLYEGLLHKVNDKVKAHIRSGIFFHFHWSTSFRFSSKSLYNIIKKYYRSSQAPAAPLLQPL